MIDHYISLSVPNLKGNELQYISDAIEKEWVSTGGAYIQTFEDKMAEYLHMPTAVAVQSGTAGLHLALLTHHIGSDDAVIVPTLTFIAAVNPVAYTGALPIFMDCDESLCMDMDKVESFCQHECDFENNQLIHKKSQKHVRAMLVVHIFGNLANMEKAIDLSKKYNLILIEDATEALGSYYTAGPFAGKYAGTLGDVGVFSFNGNKIITTGGGGMLVSPHETIIKYARYLSTQAKDDMIRFQHNEIGYNYRMTNLQAAVGVAQLEQLETFIETKKANYLRYQQNGIPLWSFRKDTRPNYWFYSYATNQRDACMTFLEGKKIQTRPIWHLLHELPPYKDAIHYQIEQANIYWQQIVNLPCSSNLSAEEVDYVSDMIHEFEKQ